MRVFRCPRCRAEDISADAHPTRVLDDGNERVVFVCRGCYRPAELEYRIACESTEVAYTPLSIRSALRLLRGFYAERLAEYEDPDALMNEADRFAAARRIREALAEVERRLAIAPVDPS